MHFSLFLRLVFFLPLLLIGYLTPAWGDYELPPGERITNLPDIMRAIPQKEAYELYEPPIGRNFDLKNFWMRADLRIRPEWRNGVCFGGAAPMGGVCNAFDPAAGTATRARAGRGAVDSYVHQWVRLGIGYDLSPGVNFYMEIIDAANWGSNGHPNNAGNGGDPLNHNCSTIVNGACRLGVRAAYLLIRDIVGIKELNVKVGRQYVVFGNHSLFGHFDWANTGYSHDGIMFNYRGNRHVESWLGWFRSAETDLLQAAPFGSVDGPVAGVVNGQPDGGGDADWFIFYNLIKTVPGFVIEPYYVLYRNDMHESVNAGMGLGTPKHSSQLRHMLGVRTELRQGNWDVTNETAWQFGQMADGLGMDNDRNLSINAWATRNWLGYTVYEHKWKPRVAVGFDYASGDGNANCAVGDVPSQQATPLPTTGMTCRTANTFENFFPTNYIHVGYMLNGAWRNSVQPQINVQARPTVRDHVEVWAQRHYLASARDNWYRGAQGPLVFSRADNTVNHVGDEIDFSWTRMFADGKVSLTVTYGHFFVGEYVRHNLGTSSDQEWAMIQLWMNF